MGEKTGIFDPRHVQILLRTYRTGGVAAILAHTGDPNVALQDWFEKHDANEKLKATKDIHHYNRNSNNDSKSNSNSDGNSDRSRWKPIRAVVHRLKSSKIKGFKLQNVSSI